MEGICGFDVIVYICQHVSYDMPLADFLKTSDEIALDIDVAFVVK